MPDEPLLLAAGALLSTDLGVAVPAWLQCELGLPGHQIPRLLCRLSIEPDSCMRDDHETFGRCGAWLLLVAKFVPGSRSHSLASLGCVAAGSSSSMSQARRRESGSTWASATAAGEPSEVGASNLNAGSQPAQWCRGSRSQAPTGGRGVSIRVDRDYHPRFDFGGGAAYADVRCGRMGR